MLQHPGVSKRHCILVKTDGLLVIRDLATTNGTKVKGQRVRWAALLPDDRISLGGYKLRVYLGADDMLSPSEQRGVRAGADLDTGLGDSGIDAGVTLSPGARGAAGSVNATDIPGALRVRRPASHGGAQPDGRAGPGG